MTTLIAAPWLTTPESNAHAASMSPDTKPEPIPVRAAISTSDSTPPRVLAGKGPRVSTATIGTILNAYGRANVVAKPIGPEQFVAIANLTLSDNARADVLSGDLDPRLLTALSKALETHRLEITTFVTGHTKYVRGTSKVSNHVGGRAADIAAVDGRDVSKANAAAKTLMTEMQAFNETYRPTEIGGPWDIDGPEGVGFTNPGHNDHVHVGFDD